MLIPRKERGKGFSRNGGVARLFLSLSQSRTSLKLKGWAGAWKDAIIVAQKSARDKSNLRQASGRETEWGKGEEGSLGGRVRGYNAGILPDAGVRHEPLNSYRSVTGVQWATTTDCEDFRLNKRPTRIIFREDAPSSVTFLKICTYVYKYIEFDVINIRDIRLIWLEWE